MALENYHSITRLNLMQAFEAAWAAACKVEASIMMVPAESVFLVGPISFSGPYCQANIIFQVNLWNNRMENLKDTFYRLRNFLMKF